MTTPIRAALVPKSSLRGLVCDGLRAVQKEHLSLIEEGIRGGFADSLDIDTPLRKRAMALDQLKEHLAPAARIADWFWVASGKVDFLPIEKAHLRLASCGIRFVGTRLLAKHLPEAPASTPKGKRRADGRVSGGARARR